VCCGVCACLSVYMCVCVCLSVSAVCACVDYVLMHIYTHISRCITSGPLRVGSSTNAFPVPSSSGCTKRVREHTNEFEQMRERVCIYAHVYTHAHMYVCKSVRVRACVCMVVFMCAYSTKTDISIDLQGFSDSKIAANNQALSCIVYTAL